MDFPIDSLKPKLFSTLDEGYKKFVVDAPTGSGKSTRLPIMLSEKLDGRILVLQPRRVAARLLAKYVAQQMGSSAGQAAGWHIRLDKNFNAQTKIVFLTEGILARMLLADPSLKDVSAIIFDEFHERNIYSDISFALALETLKKHRPDLILMLCSASMDSVKLASFMGERVCSLFCDSRLFPIEVSYSPVRGVNERVWDRAALEFERLAKENSEGDFLIFMPGAYEISRTISAISKLGIARKFEILPLHGNLSAQAQDRAVGAFDKRKVVVATNIAETSLTISGVKFVIDSGLARVARYDAARGVNTLLTERVSLASAIQRTGRAGRTQAGYAVRLWRQADEISFEAYTVPEILRLDLSQILLWLLSANFKIENLALLDMPTKPSLERAFKTLHELSAISEDEKITKLGQAMSRFPTEPRYARVLLEAASRNCLERVALWLAVCEVGKLKLELSDERADFERLNLLDDPKSELDEIAQLAQLARAYKFDEKFCRDFGIHSLNARRAFELASDFVRLASGILKSDDKFEKDNFDNASMSILAAFSDHVCVRLNEGTLACAIVGGKRCEVRRDSKKYASKIFCALDLNEQSLQGRVSIMASLICPIKEEYLKEFFPHDFSEISESVFDEQLKRMVSVHKTKFRDLSLSEVFSDKVSDEETAKAFCEQILSGKLKLKNWGEAEDDFVERINFAALVCPESGISAIDEDAKKIIYEQICIDAKSYSDVKNATIMPYLKDWLSSEQLALLDYLLPKFIELPKRFKPVKIRYDIATKRAYVSAKFSELYDFDEKKLKIADGKIKATFEILAPNGRPVQLTQNLSEFWKTSWEPIKKELKARYPKHFKEK